MPHSVYRYIMHGRFSVQLGASNPFGKIPIDQTIEETVTKYTKPPGNTKGSSLRSAAQYICILPKR